MKLEVNNSFCKFSNIDSNTRDLVARVLTYQNDIQAEKGQLFYQLNRAKRSNNGKLYHAILAKIKQLEANEFVCWLRDDQFPTGHMNIVRAVLDKAGKAYELVDQRNVPGRDGIFKWYNRPFEPRYYQKEAINLALSQGRGVIESAVGTGKSLMMAYIVKELSVNSLIVVPSTGLSDQLYNDFKVWFGPNKVEIVNTKAVRSGKNLKPIRIITIHSLASLQKSGELSNLIHDVNALYVDEIHHAGASSYTNLLTEMNHIYYRFGFTGTFLRNDSKSLDMWGFLSNVLYRYSASQAIAEGYLTPLQVNMYELHGKGSRNYQKEYDLNYCGNAQLLQKVTEICYGAPGQQVLILVNRKDKAGKIFHEYLNANGISNAYISGDNKKEEITQTIRDFNDKKINVLIGSSVIGEGIDVRSTDHLIMCQGGKSEIVMVQAIGRGIRLFEGKSKAYVHDFHFSGTKYMERHYEKRREIYDRNFQCEIKYVQ